MEEVKVLKLQSNLKIAHLLYTKCKIMVWIQVDVEQQFRRQYKQTMEHEKDKVPGHLFCRIESTHSGQNPI